MLISYNSCCSTTNIFWYILVSKALVPRNTFIFLLARVFVSGRGNRCLMGSMEPNIAIYVPWTRLYCSFTSYPPPPSRFYKYFHIQRSYFRFGDCNSDLPLTRPFPIQVLSEFVIVLAQVGELPRPPPPTSQDSTHPVTNLTAEGHSSGGDDRESVSAPRPPGRKDTTM